MNYNCCMSKEVLSRLKGELSMRRAELIAKGDKGWLAYDEMLEFVYEVEETKKGKQIEIITDCGHSYRITSGVLKGKDITREGDEN